MFRFSKLKNFGAKASWCFFNNFNRFYTFNICFRMPINNLNTTCKQTCYYIISPLYPFTGECASKIMPSLSVIFLINGDFFKKNIAFGKILSLN